MSETINNTEEREPYAVELEEPLKFEHDVEASILTSGKLGSLANEYFKAAFPGDYEGCTIEYNHKGLSLSLFFRHETQRSDDVVYGVELSTAKKTFNKTMDQIRRRDYLVKEGDRYSLTQDGEDVIKPLLFRNLVSNNGKVNWGSVLSEVADNSMGNLYAIRTAQYTKISGINLDLVCALLFGKKDVDGNNVVYTVEVKGYKGQGYSQAPSSNLILWVNRINCNKVEATGLDLGLGFGSNIIR